MKYRHIDRTGSRGEIDNHGTDASPSLILEMQHAWKREKCKEQERDNTVPRMT